MNLDLNINISCGKETQDILTLDPYNPQRALQHGGEKSVCSLFGYKAPEWTQPNDDYKPGSVEHIEFFSEIFAETRTLSVYLPNEHQEHKRYPLLLCLDGDDYCDYGDMKTVLDNLMGANEMLPTIVAFIGATDRDREFAANPSMRNFSQPKSSNTSKDALIFIKIQRNEPSWALV